MRSTITSAMKKSIKICLILMTAGMDGSVFNALAQQENATGTFFGEPVAKANYDFALRTVLSFNTPWGAIPRDREQLERRIWDDLILSYEAHRCQITVDNHELEAQISGMIKNEHGPLNWKNDKQAYESWILEKFGIPIDMFENQIRHLAQLKKFHSEVLDSISPIVTENEAFQEFLNEQNSLSVELAQFKTFEEAKFFYSIGNIKTQMLLAPVFLKNI